VAWRRVSHSRASWRRRGARARGGSQAPCLARVGHGEGAGGHDAGAGDGEGAVRDGGPQRRGARGQLHRQAERHALLVRRVLHPCTLAKTVQSMDLRRRLDRVCLRAVSGMQGRADDDELVLRHLASARRCRRRTHACHTRTHIAQSRRGSPSRRFSRSITAQRANTRLWRRASPPVRTPSTSRPTQRAPTAKRKPSRHVACVWARAEGRGSRPCRCSRNCDDRRTSWRMR
jgi:hypothetical protein